jgi:peptide deformylase
MRASGFAVRLSPRWKARARDEATALMAALTAFRARHGFGRGIAAPQLGLGRRILALDLGAGPFPLYNPEITWRSDDTFELWDDCFSVPTSWCACAGTARSACTIATTRFRLRAGSSCPRARRAGAARGSTT